MKYGYEQDMYFMYLQNNNNNSNNNDFNIFVHQFWGLKIETLQNHFILNLLNFYFSFW